MRLNNLVIGDPWLEVAQQTAERCRRLATRQHVAATGKDALQLALEYLPEVVVLSLDFTDPAAEDSILFNAANGTGPYILDHWTPGEELVLVANENYWRQEGDPIWEGGPSGVASIKRVVTLFVDEWGTRLGDPSAGRASLAQLYK